MSDAITQSDEPQELDLHNQIIEATFVGVQDGGLLFDLGEDRKGLVERDEFSAEIPFEEGARVEILVEQPVGDT
ncbi:MAG: hypothetical protein ACNA8W_24105, partial [Bradymonadaceae bacterium]